MYVVLGAVCGLITLLGTLWGGIYLCVNWCSKRRMARKPTTYKLIEDTEDLPPCTFVFFSYLKHTIQL